MCLAANGGAVPESLKSVVIGRTGRSRTESWAGRRAVAMLAGFLLVLCALAVEPAAGQTITLRADSAWTRGDHHLAEQLYRDRLEEHPSDATALHRLAILAMRRAAFDECDALLRRLLILAPADTDAHITRARLIAARGDLVGARAVVDSILGNRPDDVGALQALGQFRAWNADSKGSEKAWRQALALDPSNLDTRLGLARTLRQQGRHAAAAEILTAVPIDSSYADLLDELEWIALALGPRAGTTFVYEDDSDGNAIATLVMSAAVRPAPRFEIRADAYVRDAELGAGSVRRRTARGGTFTLWTQTEPGWALHASAGAGLSDAASAPTLAAWSVGVATPARNRVAGGLSFSQAPFDVTALTTENRVSLREMAVDGRWAPSRMWSVLMEAGVARFDARASGAQNDRWRGKAEIVRRLNDSFGLALAGRAFGFADNTSDGYFDPDLYAASEIAARLHRESRHWVLDGEVAPGIEQITSSGNAAGSLRARAGLTYLLRPGRQLRLNVIYANSGIQQLSPSGGGDYRYASAGIGILWRF